MIYVALLRGINVGGNRKVDMKSLKATFEGLGLQNVKTYINSGNVVFSDTKHSSAQLVALIEKAIEKDFGFPVNVLVCDQKTMNAIAKELPDSWEANDTIKCDVMFLWENSNTSKILDQLIIKPDIDHVKYVNGAILWYIERKDAGKSGMYRLIGTKLYKEMTIRNSNTFRKLVGMMGEI